MEELKTDVVEEKVETPEGDENVEKMLKTLLASSKSEISNEVKTDLKAQMEAWMKEQKELKEKGAGLYNKEVKADREVLNQKFKAISNAIAYGNDASLKEMTTDAQGTPFAGYVVDSELSAEIRHLVTEYGVARREMSTIQISKGDLKANSLTTDPSVFWVDEGAVIGSTEVVLNQDKLELKKLGAIVAITRELIEDGEVDLFSFTAGRIAEGLAKAEDKAFFTGAGSEDASNGGFTGVLNNTNVNTVTMTGTTFASLSGDDFLDMIDKTPSGALGNAKFILNRTIMSVIRKLTASETDKTPIYQPISASGPETLWGYPVVYSEVFPKITDSAEDTPFILFGDLKKACLLGYKGGIDAEMFNSGVVRNVAGTADINLITTDRKAIRWIERVGYITILPKAVTRLKTGETS